MQDKLYYPGEEEKKPILGMYYSYLQLLEKWHEKELDLFYVNVKEVTNRSPLPNFRAI